MKRVIRQLPSMRCLTAFETAARLSSFTAAAAEMNTSQSSVSRHIAELEALVGVSLFIRERQRVRLSDQGEHLLQSVRHGLDGIRSGLQLVADWGTGGDVIIACSHAVSHLVLMPRFETLQAAMGAESRIRVMTLEYETLESLADPQADILFAFDPKDTREQDRAVILREAVMPVCSPGFLEVHADELGGSLAAWGALPLLEMADTSRGGAHWSEWFRRCGTPKPATDYVLYDNYVYLLEAAASGRGVALGMKGLIERHLAAGALVPARGDYLTLGHTFDAVLTPRGRLKPAARACLGELAKIFENEGLTKPPDSPEAL